MSKGKTRPGVGGIGGYASITSANPDKVAQEIMDRDRFEAVGGGLDSSFDSEEMDQELRDKVEGQMKLLKPEEGDEEEEEDKYNFSQNTDLTYYGMMDADEKLVTLNNRVQ